MSSVWLINKCDSVWLGGHLTSHVNFAQVHVRAYKAFSCNAQIHLHKVVSKHSAGSGRLIWPYNVIAKMSSRMVQHVTELCVRWKMQAHFGKC